MTTSLPPDEGSVEDDISPESRRSPWPGILLRLLATLVVLGGLYAVAANVLGGQVASGTKVGGVDIGGLTADRAQAKVRAYADEVMARPVELEAAGRSLEVAPADAGLGFDVDGSLEGLTGVSYHPSDVMARLTGGTSHELVRTVDDARLTAAVRTLAPKVAQKPVSGDVRFVLGNLEVDEAKVGRELDVPATVEAVKAAWPGSTRVKAPVKTTEPSISQPEIDEFVETFATPAMSGNVTLRAGEQDVTLSPRDLSALLSADDIKGTLTPVLKEKGLVGAVRAIAPGVEKAPVNATVSLAKGVDHPTVVPGAPGTEIETDGLVQHVLDAARGEGAERVVEVPVTAKEPELDGKGWRMDQVIGDFRTVLPTGTKYESRTHNIATGAAKLTGTVVYPGERFSLLRVIGDVSTQDEYKEAGVINAGRLQDSRGGGLSQLSTTLFNAAFFAGVELNEWMAHAYYIDRYPEGRESTLWYPSIDNIWTNTTDSPIIVHAQVSPAKDSLRVWLMGEKTFTVEESTSPRRNIVKPEKVEDDSLECKTMHPTDGFDVTVKRTVKKGGKVVGTDSWDTHYIPEDEVTCTNPAAKPE